MRGDIIILKIKEKNQHISKYVGGDLENKN